MNSAFDILESYSLKRQAKTLKKKTLLSHAREKTKHDPPPHYAAHNHLLIGVNGHDFSYILGKRPEERASVWHKSNLVLRVVVSYKR